MTRHVVCAAVVSAVCSAACGAGNEPAKTYDIPKEPTLTTPKGAYQTAWLDVGGVKAFLGLRDGKPVQFWSLSKQMPGGPAPAGSPKLLTDGLRGQTVGGKTTAEIDLRLVSIWAPQSRLGTMTLSLEFTAADGKASGTWKNKGDKEAGGALTGVMLDEAAARKEFGIAAGQDWPGFYGSLAAGVGAPYGKPLIDDLTKARPVWRSETVSLSGWGTGVDARYKGRAAYGTLCGGSSSPIAADGVVYLYHYRPSGEVTPEGADAEFLAKYEHPVEKESIRRYLSKRADVVVSAIDATNGKTLWESVWPLKQGNFQTHKWRSHNHTPAVAKGTLVVSDYSMGLHAFDAKTGQLKWTRGGGGDVVGNGGIVGPTISGDIVVFPAKNATYGLDRATGAEKWKAIGSASTRRMVIDGKERVLIVGPQMVLVDPATGQEVARGEFPAVEAKGRKDTGRGIGANLRCEGPYIVSFEAGDGSDGGTKTFFAMKVSGNKIEKVWTHEGKYVLEDGHTDFAIVGGKVFTAVQKEGAFCIDLATGKTIRALPEFTSHSNPIYTAVDNRILWQPECQHGRQHIQLMDADTFTPLGANWSPPHNDTTAYGEMPIANIVIDGRLIIRGMDGVYCYDIRK